MAMGSPEQTQVLMKMAGLLTQGRAGGKELRVRLSPHKPPSRFWVQESAGPSPGS